MKQGKWPDESMPRKPFGASRHRLPDSCNDCDDKGPNNLSDISGNWIAVCGVCVYEYDDSTHKEAEEGNSVSRPAASYFPTEPGNHEEDIEKNKDKLAKLYLINEDRIARMYLKEIEKRNKRIFSKLHSAMTRDVSSDGQDTDTDYPILVTAFVLIAVTSFLAALDSKTWQLSLTGWMHGFMAGFFLLFGFVKLMDLRAFARSFAYYDLVAARVPLYGLLYPFMEIGVAWLYIIIPHSPTLNAFCLAWMLLGAAGAFRGLLERHGSPVACACMGSRIRLPLSWITVAEYLLMALMTLPALLP